MHSTMNAQQNGVDNAVNKSALTGAWKSIGDGYLLKVDDKAITLYSYTSKYCYKEQNDYLVDLLNTGSQFYFNKSKDTLSVYLHDFGNQTKKLQKENKLYRLKKFPENCVALTETQRNDPEYLFELFFSTLKENYAFAKERNMDWGRIYNDYRPKISSQTSKADLFNILGEIVTMTKDQHTKIISSSIF